jgi:hypothetical protein
VITGKREDRVLLCARIAGKAFADEVVAAVQGHAATPDVDTDAPLVVVRRRAGCIAEAFQSGGTRVRVNAAAGSSEPWMAMDSGAAALVL